MFYDAIVFFSFSYFLNQMNEKSNMQSEKQYSEENENLLKEAELLSLRQQLQPHFLFNSLNSISALLMINPEKAQNMLHELSDFLRDTLRKEGNQLLSLETEIGHLQKYLNIETIRFEQRLKVEIAIDNETKGLLLPALILQPIVENAIKFGLYGTSKEVLIKINAKMQNNILLIEVFNPFDTDTRTHQKGEGFGLKSVSRRLNLIYSRNDLLKTKTDSDIFVAIATDPAPVVWQKFPYKLSIVTPTHS
jgi:LytS/YehU family sensor histidine kinase